ncbi:hypothetical protein K0M31_005141 [Melipona bicolor]|uniref:Uncharacterized protein n=1 Tax=Melipona bicolor TaxID=60889 RepID=A0AA40KNC8_9HYME|nr:hypothetical protein K0M31_005141 [Melipona bicolor]
MEWLSLLDALLVGLFSRMKVFNNFSALIRRLPEFLLNCTLVKLESAVWQADKSSRTAIKKVSGCSEKSGAWTFQTISGIIDARRISLFEGERRLLPFPAKVLRLGNGEAAGVFIFQVKRLE